MHCCGSILYFLFMLHVFVQGEWGPEGPVEEVCGGGADAEEGGEPGKWR